MVLTAADLIEAVKLHQQVKGLSDKAFARLIGIDNSTWSLIKSGKRNPGVKVLMAIASNIPEAVHVQVGKLNLGDGIRVKDLPLPENVTVVSDPEALVVTVRAVAAEQRR